MTFRQQASFGVHLLVMMGTFYAVGHVVGGALTGKPAYVSTRCVYCPLLASRLQPAYPFHVSACIPDAIAAP